MTTTVPSPRADTVPGYPYRVSEVCRPVVICRSRPPHRADDNDRASVGEGEVQEPGELLERVGAARHDNAVELTIGGEQRDEVAREPRAVVHREDRARQVGERLCLEPGETFGVRQPGDQFPGAEPPSQGVPDRAAHRDDAHAWQWHGQRPQASPRSREAAR